MLVLSRLYILLLWRRPPELSSFSPCNEWIDRCFARCAQSSLRLRHPKLCACAWVTLELHLPGCWWLSSVCPSISLNRGHKAHTQYSDSLHLTRVCLPAGLLFYRELELDAQVRNKPRGDGNNIICCSRNPPTSNWWPRRRRRLLILYTQQQLSGWLRVIAEHQVYIYISGRAGIVVVLNQHSLERGRERLAQLEKNKVLAPRNIQEVETRLYIRE